MTALIAAVNMTQEQILAGIDVLEVSVVEFSQASLVQVQDDMNARQQASDPIVADVVRVTEDPAMNVVIVGATNPSAALQNAMQSSYGARVLVQYSDPPVEAAGPFDDNTTPHKGGLAIRTFSVAGNGQKTCSSAVAVKKVGGDNSTYLLTAGHCFPNDTAGQQVGNTSCFSGSAPKIGELPALGRKKTPDMENRNSMDAAIIAGSFKSQLYTGEGYRYGDITSQACDSLGTGIGYGWRRVGERATVANPGSKVCKWGRASGFRCNYTIKNLNKPSGLMNATIGNQSGLGAQDTDSGGAVFTILQTGSRAGQIHFHGLLIRSQDGNTRHGFKAFDFWPNNILEDPARFGVRAILSPKN
ncbi:MAG: hypothetical protein ACT4QF_17150 [Sporichthyaceae bacterium]